MHDELRVPMMERKQKKCVFLLIDGLGDVSLPSLAHQTPLEHARTPWLDAAASGGLNGLLDPVEMGLACGSDTAHLSILGYAPRKYYRGRGSFEAMGAGISMREGDVAFKCNFSTLEEGGGGGGGGGNGGTAAGAASAAHDGDTVAVAPIVKRRRVDRGFPAWGIPLCDALDGIPVPGFPELEVTVKYATEHRCGVRLRTKRVAGASGGAGGRAAVGAGAATPRLTDRISGTDPLKDGLPLRTPQPLAADPAAEYSAGALKAVSDAFINVLGAHPLNEARRRRDEPPANAVLLRGPGERIAAPSFQQRHGVRAFMIAPTAIIAGLGLSLELDLVKVPGASGDYHTDLAAKARAVVDTFARPARPLPDATGAAQYEFGFVHVKAVDDAGHDRNVGGKVEWIENCDGMVGQLVRGLCARADDDFVLVVTGDHSTPVLSGDHSYEPVPFLICDCARARAAHDEAVPPPAAAGRAGARDMALAEAAALQSNRTIAGRSDSVPAFSELHAADGALGRFCGEEVMRIVQQFCQWPSDS